MSGPKCDSYYVEAQRVREQRMKALRAAASEADKRLAAVTKKARDVEADCGVVIAAALNPIPQLPSDEGSPEDFEGHISQVHCLIAEISAQIERAEGVVQLRTLLSSAVHAEQVSDWSGNLHQSQPVSRTSSLPNESDRRDETVQRILNRLIGNVTEEEQGKIENILREFYDAATLTRVEVIEAQLRLTVQIINDRFLKIQEEKTVASILLAELVGLTGSEVESIREELQAVMDRRVPMPRKAAERVALARKRAERKMADEYAGQVVRQELQRLGYVLGANFETMFTEGGEAVLQSPEQGEYGVQIAVDASCGMMNMEVVRLTESASISDPERRLRDKEAEEKWCANHDSLLAALRSRGVKGRTIKNTPAGERLVPHIQGNAHSAQPRRTKKAALKQRELR